MKKKRGPGRPLGSKKKLYQYVLDYKTPLELIRSGMSIRNVKRETGVSPTTLIKVKRMVGL